MKNERLANYYRTLEITTILTRGHKEIALMCKRKVKKIYAVVNLPCKEIDGRLKKVYTEYTQKRYVQGKPCVYTIAVTLAVRSHLFSCRTQ